LPIWDSRNGKYSCADTWGKLREVHPVVYWWRLVWFPTAIPRHSFLLWIAFRDALVTKQKMCCWGYLGKSLCLFCYGGEESREHLFFRCSFSSWIWTSIMAVCSFLNVPLDWENIGSWGATVLHGKSLKASLGRLCLGATVYHLWWQRNDLLQCNTPRTEDSILVQINWDVRARVLAKGKFKSLGKNLELVYRWNLQSLLF
jgi:hypothetical protein